MRVQFVVVERGPSTSTNIKQVSKTTIPHTSSLVLAEDTILFLERDAKEALLTQRGADLLITHDFHALPLLKFSCIVWMVLKHKECYVITDSMCYWYAFMVVEVAKTYYSSTAINPNGTHSICHMLSRCQVRCWEGACSGVTDCWKRLRVRRTLKHFWNWEAVRV